LTIISGRKGSKTLSRKEVEMSLKELITRVNLKSMAGVRSFNRGEEYFERGCVGPVREKDGVVSAKVHGTRTYESRLKTMRSSRGEVHLDYSCTCPVYRDGEFCKHCVALGLAWIDSMKSAKQKAEPSASGKRNVVTLKDIRKWLEAQNPKLLFDMLLKQVESDDRLREELTLKSLSTSLRYGLASYSATAYRNDHYAAALKPVLRNPLSRRKLSVYLLSGRGGFVLWSRPCP
jgi:uncharacterized Zn finger protein